MSGVRIRWAALTAALALSAPLTWLAHPAGAVLCAEPDVEKELSAGNTLAVVTRTDANGGSARYRVEQSTGAPLPEAFTGKADFGGGCDPSAYHEYVTAMVVPKKGGALLSYGKPTIDVGAALRRLGKTPEVTSTAAPVAVLAGSFGDSRLAAVDDRGEVVAWDRRPGFLTNVAICPGGEAVVATGYPAADSVERELVVHDARSLAVHRTLDLPLGAQFVDAVRCADPTGRQVQVLVNDDESSRAGSLLYTATDGGTTSRRLPLELSNPLADYNGFLGATEVKGSAEESHVVHIAPSGSVRHLPSFGGVGIVLNLALSPDRSVAAIAFSPTEDPDTPPSTGEQPPNHLLTFDPFTGRELARWIPDEEPRDLVWTRDGHLLVRLGYRNRFEGYRPGTLELRDRELRPLGSLPTTPAAAVASVGEILFGFGNTRLTLTRPQSAPRVVDNLWLAGTTGVVPLGFVEPVGVVVSTDDPAPFVLGGLAAAMAGLFLGTVRSRTA